MSEDTRAISVGLVQAIVAYLSARPYNEVSEAISLLSSLPEGEIMPGLTLENIKDPQGYQPEQLADLAYEFLDDKGIAKLQGILGEELERRSLPAGDG